MLNHAIEWFGEYVQTQNIFPHTVQYSIVQYTICTVHVQLHVYCISIVMHDLHLHVTDILTFKKIFYYDKKNKNYNYALNQQTAKRLIVNIK